MPRLLFIVNVDWFFLSHRLPVALAARDAGFEVHVATALTGPASVIKSHGFTLHPISLDRRNASPLDALRLVWTLWRLMRTLRPSIVHLVTSVMTKARSQTPRSGSAEVVSVSRKM